MNWVICQPSIGGPSTLKFSSKGGLKNVSDAQKLDKSHDCARLPHVSCLGFTHLSYSGLAHIPFGSNQAQLGRIPLINGVRQLVTHSSSQGLDCLSACVIVLLHG